MDEKATWNRAWPGRAVGCWGVVSSHLRERQRVVTVSLALSLTSLMPPGCSSRWQGKLNARLSPEPGATRSHHRGLATLWLAQPSDSIKFQDEPSTLWVPQRAFSLQGSQRTSRSQVQHVFNDQSERDLQCLAGSFGSQLVFSSTWPRDGFYRMAYHEVWPTPRYGTPQVFKAQRKCT